MHDHRETLALAAAAIDFQLDPAERSQLDAALETCSLCRRQDSAMRATATILRRPSDIGTPSRVRDVVLGAALRGGRRAPRFGVLELASLSLLVVLGGTAVVIGSRGFGILPPVETSSPGPVQTVSPVTTATPLPTPEPLPTPVPVETATASAPSPDANGPLRPGEIAAMVTDGRLVIRTLPKTGADSAIFKTRLYPGQRVLALEGPVEASGYPWYRVRLGVIEGWVASAGQDGDPWLAPVRNGLIAFVRDTGDGVSEAIHTIGADGTAESVLLSVPNIVHYEQLTWSPDGRQLAFVGVPAAPIDAPSEIFVVDADGSNLVQLTQNDLFDDGPAWSPDSTRLAFRQSNPDDSDSTVAVIRADGSGIAFLGPGELPVWSPDGLLISMTVPDGGSSRIWVQAPDGAGRRQVSDAAVDLARPGWSPDGQSLVFSSSGLFLVDVESGSTTPLATGPGATPNWSPGGTIAFSRTGSASPGVFVVESDGSGLRRVSDDTAVASLPAWSPDGRRLLLTSELAGPITIVDLGNGDVTLVGDDRGANRSAAWQPRLP